MTRGFARSCSSNASVTGARWALAARREHPEGPGRLWLPWRGAHLGGLCDAADEGDFRRGLELEGLGADLTRDGMEDLGFYVCVADLEDELIRCLGDDAAEGVLEEQGDLMSFRTFQEQPGWRGRATGEQLRRILGTGSGRKIRVGPTG